MSKGRRREKQAAEIYEAAGFETFRPPRTKFDENDMFGLFDMVAVKPNAHTRWVQVKSNQPRGMEDWFNDAHGLVSRIGNRVEYLVCHDRQGWRVFKGDRDPFRVAVDERDMDVNMGEGVTAWLRGERDA